jgi:hypothetical protein
VRTASTGRVVRGMCAGSPATSSEWRRVVRRGLEVSESAGGWRWAKRFRAQFGCDLDEVFGAEIGDLVARGLLERLPDRVRLTPAGMLLGNRVFAEFME